MKNLNTLTSESENTKIFLQAIREQKTIDEGLVTTV